MFFKKSYTFFSIRSEVSKFENLLITLNKDFSVPEDKLINFQIAVSEAFVNAIVHGNKENSNKLVFIDIEFNGNILSVTIKDQGSGFDISTLPDPTKEENLFKEHGRGIFIMRTLTDVFRCESSDEGTKYYLAINK